MRSTVRISIIVMFLAVVTSLSAQKSYKLEVGFTNPGIHGSDTSSIYLKGLRIGGTVDFKLKKNFSLLTGALYNLVYSNKVQKYRNSKQVNYIIIGQSIDIPLRFTYTYPVSRNMKFFAFGGPNLNIGLGSMRGIVSTLDTAQIRTTGITSNMTNLYSSSLLNRLNLQVGLGTGVQWKKYILKGGYDFGLTNMNAGDTKKTHQNSWYISLAYEF